MSENERKIVLVRAKDAGVQVGEFVSVDGSSVVLRHAHKVWRWRGANTLYELARDGAHMTSHTRISLASPGLVTILGACEVIEVSDGAVKNLTTPRWL